MELLKICFWLKIYLILNEFDVFNFFFFRDFDICYFFKNK